MIFSPLKSVLLLATARLLTTAMAATTLVSESSQRLPMALSTVLTDLEADGLGGELHTACLITSRSVTRVEKQAVLGQLLETTVDDPTSRVLATSRGLALAQPPCTTSSTTTTSTSSSLEEVVQASVACQGLIVFVPSPLDLARGEGLMDALAPVMERLQQFQDDDDTTTSSNPPCLVVVYDPSTGKAATQTKLEAAAAAVSPTGSRNPLAQVFRGGVSYVTASQVAEQIVSAPTTTPLVAKALVAKVVAESRNLLTLLGAETAPGQAATKIVSGSPAELAAARTLEPAKRAALATARAQIMEATQNNQKLVPAFGALVDAVLKQAQESLASTTSHKSALTTTVGKELSASLVQELWSEGRDVLEGQLSLLQTASFASFQQSLGQLRLGPTLAHDMQQAVTTAVQDFGRLASPLLPPTATRTWKQRVSVAQAAFAQGLQTFCHDRLQAAEASGQFKPVPRKGVTIGMHWLLPKPFGNDYRQEPWMVHANDHMVYVPRRSTKVTDITAEDVTTGDGDWRDAVVPSPAGKDMLYMQ